MSKLLLKAHQNCFYIFLFIIFNSLVPPFFSASLLVFTDVFHYRFFCTDFDIFTIFQGLSLLCCINIRFGYMCKKSKFSNLRRKTIIKVCYLAISLPNNMCFAFFLIISNFHIKLQSLAKLVER